MAAVWNGTTTITIGGAGNTLASMYSDIGDDTVMSNPSAGLYIINGVKVRYINISALGELIVGNPLDFSEYEELRFQFSGTNYQNRFYVYEGGIFKQYGNTKVILNYGCTSAQYPHYCYFHGAVHIEGDDTYQPIIKGPRRFYFYQYASNESYYENSELTLYKCKIGECWGNYIYMTAYGAWWKTFNVEDVTLINDLYTSSIQYGINCFTLGEVYDFPAFKNMHLDNSVNVLQHLSYGGTISHIKDTTIVTTRPSYTFYMSGAQTFGGWRNPSRTWHTTTESAKIKKVGQWIDGMHDNVDIQTTYSYQYYIAAYCQFIAKNCPNTNDKNNLIYTGASMLCWNSDNIFNRLNIDNYGSIAKKVFLLDLTTKNSHGSLLSDCTVNVSSLNGKEFFKCVTDENGKIISRFGIGGVLCANAARTTSAETLEYWSDNSNASYHIISVLKEGYISETQNIVMNQDRSLEIILSDVVDNVILPEGYAGELTGPLSQPGGDDGMNIEDLQGYINDTYDVIPIQIKKVVVDGEQGVTVEVINTTMSEALTHPDLDDTTTSGLQQNYDIMKQMTDIIADKIITHIVDEAITEGAGNTLAALSTDVNNVNSKLLSLLTGLTSWVPVTMDGGASLKVTLAGAGMPAWVSDLTALQTSIPIDYEYDAQEKNII